MDEWQPNFLDSSPMFEPLRGVGAALAKLGRWPTLAEYNALLDPPIYTASGAALRFVSQAGKPARMEDRYETRIYLNGEVQTRTENWHDLFNALVWLAFPRTKAAINARHFEAISQGGEGNRGKTQDALTLFDESGIVVLHAEDELAGLIRDFRWKELFCERRQEVTKRMKFVIFGHSLYEKALKPYIGFTGKGLLIKVEQAFFDLPPEAQIQTVDLLLADHFAAAGRLSSQALTPVPLLGVPGWWSENESPVFYDNTDYFRPAGKKKKENY
ncbi:MAG: DUF3025 domain-containing protein [Sulfuricella sp.]|jgi:hypothetical protein